MDSWVPLFDIFLNSPCPETEASHWLNQSFNASSSPTITTNSLLSLLSKPTNAVLTDSSSSQTKRIMWIQTLPNSIQYRVLSFLTLEHRRFCGKNLAKLARNVLNEAEGLDLWVKKAAHQLLDKVSEPYYEWVSCLNLDSEEERFENEFESIPDWLKDDASANGSLLPWLPISRDELNSHMPIDTYNEHGNSYIDVKEDEEKNTNDVMREVNAVYDHINSETKEMAASFKTRVLTFESASKSVRLANEIRKLCMERGANSLTILGLIEPWKADDENASILVSNLLNGSDDELGWPSHVLCSVVLPKLLVLEEPASRVLVTSTLEYCKLHQRATVYALLFPLILRKEGINKAISDVITRIIKECLHSAHISSFCHTLLCGERKFMCLPCHLCLISHELVWTESLFNLLQNILNHNVHLTQDSVDKVVHKIRESAGRFSKSLKFGNLVLCLVNKCGPLLKPYKLLLIEAVEGTHTLVTKSILSKLDTL
ncbi:uncharacterized protein LOC130779064 isoform X1 [Actinidia eriantha]|uniref:uncharacterized protein LOC130779064 isoform X1 n=2 Tax=Actinidia eriantha TaxID=165200 RepID=UPI00258C4A88|nr:uncharacterized protein LOC130779064 isoform X1 [Actinidia eriantha]